LAENGRAFGLVLSGLLLLLVTQAVGSPKGRNRTGPSNFLISIKGFRVVAGVALSYCRLKLLYFACYRLGGRIRFRYPKVELATVSNRAASG
jgi:hypothetical protein